jgi:hypothetical protein
MDIGTILFYLFFFIVMPVLYIRMTYWQAIAKLEMISVSLEKMTDIYANSLENMIAGAHH